MLVLLLACSPSDDASAPDTSGDTGVDAALPPGTPVWHGDIEEIVVANCAGCHADGDIAPFPLGNYAEAAPMASAMSASVAERRMPPWLASDDCTTYRNDISLTDEEIARISAWAEAGAPEGNPADAAGTTAPTASLSRVDFNLPMLEPYTPQQAPDDYRCLLLDWPETETSYVTGYQVNPGVRAELHHVVMYLAPPDQVEFYRAADAAEEGPGYTCFGGPGVGSQEDAQWLGGWAPGATNGDFPNGTGIQVEPGSLVVMQMHYNTATAEPAPDQSSIDFMVESSVENQAYIQPWADPTWLDGDGMTIPAGSTDVSHSFSYTIPYSFRIHTANLHMHTHGTSARLWVEQGGGEDCLLDIPRWDFAWQRTYVLAEPLEVENPTIRIECHWDNSGSDDIDWGEGTGDEMCLGTMLFSF